MTDFPLSDAKTVIVTDDGFLSPKLDADHADSALDLSPDAELDSLADKLPNLAMIRIGFPAFSDGRGFTLARRLRQMGYSGHLRAVGHVISDQYAMARRSGFDDVEISEELAARQPADQWESRANWQGHDYRTALGA